ncbi:uncharacterized protein [Antedon mediterranea]|uniref:uncharacterized protein n=1 Tax=Antedon mediterranea TaxID=105859 RepID=UPI003AF67596
MALYMVFLILHFIIFSSGDSKSENDVCKHGYYAKTLPKRTTKKNNKYACMKCGMCRDGVEVIASCTKWSDVKCGGCIHEDLGFIFDHITKSCQHSDVLSGKVAPEEIWTKLGLRSTTTRPRPISKRFSTTPAITISVQDSAALYPEEGPHGIKHVNSLTFEATPSAPSVLSLISVGSATILSLALILLIILSCRLKAEQDGVDSLFPCVVYKCFKGICNSESHNQTHNGRPTSEIGQFHVVTTTNKSPSEEKEKLWSEDFEFPRSISLIDLRTSDSFHSIIKLVCKSASCLEFEYGLARDSRPTSNKHKAHGAPVSFYIGDFGVKKLSKSKCESNMESEFTSFCSSHVFSDRLSDCGSVSSDDEYGAWRAFMACHNITTYDETVESDVWILKVTTV